MATCIVIATTAMVSVYISCLVVIIDKIGAYVNIKFVWPSLTWYTSFVVAVNKVRLNVKTVFPRIWIPILKIRLSWNHYIFKPVGTLYCVCARVCVRVCAIPYHEDELEKIPICRI